MQCIMQCDLDGNCLDICFYVYFAVWYVSSDQNRFFSRSPASRVINVIKQLLILNIDIITWLEEGFLEADNCMIFLRY